MKWKVREVKTASGKIAIQVFQLFQRKRTNIKHFGSAGTEEELINLKQQAHNFINQDQHFSTPLFEVKDPYFKNYKYLGFSYKYAYEFLEKVFNKFNLQNHCPDLWKDLIISQILEPSSKRQNLNNLEYFLGIKYNLNSLYRQLKKFDENLKQKIESEIILVAKKEYEFDFSFVLYDVTTLYFESFKNDEFKLPGFSKDNKHNQPQIVIGLMVTKQGFPVHYEVFKGNTFEGNTFIPTILEFKKEHKIQEITVVADSAMLSKQNLEKLVENKINYIISARLANLKQEQINLIDKNVPRIHQATFKLNELVVEYSQDRYKKDLKEMEKGLEKAKKYEGKQTTKITKLKFLQNENTTYSINQDLLSKTKQLLGLKGYVTNLNLPDKEIVDYYHNLFRVEHAFRIAKSDLEIRPVYLQKENTIKNHILLCFICLAFSVYLEIKNKTSIKQIVKTLKSVTDARIQNLKSKEILVDRNLEVTGLLD